MVAPLQFCLLSLDFLFAFILNKATSDFRGIHLDSRWEYMIKGQLPAQINTATRADFSST